MNKGDFVAHIKKSADLFCKSYPCIPHFEPSGPHLLLIPKDTYWPKCDSHGVYIIFTPGETQVSYVGKASPGWIGGRLAAKTGRPGNGDYPDRKPWITKETLYMALTYPPEICMFAPALESHLIRDLNGQGLGPTENTVWSKWLPEVTKE